MGEMAGWALLVFLIVGPSYITFRILRHHPKRLNHFRGQRLLTIRGNCCGLEPQYLLMTPAKRTRTTPGMLVNKALILSKTS